ncbi:Hypothetical protein PBC10988_20010 [Planctomycetales bacterium 10988]|nr:Hypothetical protein PBC10988_20010 [Planctomycetales bacterium 10988]
MKIAKPLFERELEKYDWQNLRIMCRKATHVPFALRKLIQAKTVKEVDEAYWRIENSVVVQGGLYQAALPTIKVLLAALIGSDPPFFVKVAALELIFQMVNGGVSAEEMEAGSHSLLEDCQQAVREEVWLFNTKKLAENAEATEEILDIIDPDRIYLAKWIK